MHTRMHLAQSPRTATCACTCPLRRIALARALLMDPRMLLLDEATSALDAESEHIVQEAIDRLMADRTTIVVAHRLSTVRTADTICVVQRGRIAERGSHDELLAIEAGVYRALVRRQMEGKQGSLSSPPSSLALAESHADQPGRLEKTGTATAA